MGPLVILRSYLHKRSVVSFLNTFSRISLFHLLNALTSSRPEGPTNLHLLL
jgi:hypothetical protein